jgi:hypothetical protein
MSSIPLLSDTLLSNIIKHNSIPLLSNIYIV